MTSFMHPRKLVLVILVPLLTVAPAAFGKGGGHEGRHEEDHNRHGHISGGNSVSPLLEEMYLLDAAFREVVSGVALGDGRRVHAALETMHGTMEKTHEGVHHGTVKLRKNADRLKSFVEMDKQFHAKLETLAEAAHRNDSNAMLSLTKQLLDGCMQCHREFRAP